MRLYQVHDNDGLLRVFNWKDEAVKFIGKREGFKLVVKTVVKEDKFSVALASLGEAVI